MKKFNFPKRSVAIVSQILTIIFILFLYILSDFIQIGGTIFLWTDPLYWLLITLNLILLVALMLTVRAMRKQKRVVQSKFINDGLQFIERARKITMGNAYSKELDDYLIEVNQQIKYETYIRKIISKFNKLELLVDLKLIRAKKADIRRKKLEELMQRPKEEILKEHIKYKEITKTALSSGVDGRITAKDNFDIWTHEKQDIAQMVGLKSLLVYLIAAIGGTFILAFIWNGWEALYGTGLKILSLSIAVWTAILQADNFVDYNITQAMHNRIDIWSVFINKIADLKEKMIIAKQQEDRLAEFEDLKLEPQEIAELKKKAEREKKNES